MSKKYSHNFSSYPELSPFVIVHSLFMHVMVLSFLLTLPMYSTVNEKGSLFGYYVYLTGEKTNKALESAEPNMSEKRIEAANSKETTIIPGKIINDIKNNEEIALPAGPVKEKGNNEGRSIVIQKEIDRSGTLKDIKPSYNVPNKEAEIIAKETDKIEKTEKETPLSAVENGVQIEKPVEPYLKPEAISSVIDQVQKKNVEKMARVDGRKNIERPYAVQLSSENDVSVSEMKSSSRGIELTVTGPSRAMEKAKMIDKSETKAEQPLTTAQSISGSKTVHDNENAIKPADNSGKAMMGKTAKAQEEKSVLGLPVDESFFHKDIKIEVLQQKAESQGVYMYLLKNNYLSLQKRHKWGKEKKIEAIVETKRNDADNEIKTVFSIAKCDEGIYTFVIENRNMVPYDTEVVFALYAGQKRERIRKISAVSVSPSSMLRFMFVLPDTVFWDDEKFFTGSIEDSDSITKFNDASGFIWKEEKD